VTHDSVNIGECHPELIPARSTYQTHRSAIDENGQEREQFLDLGPLEKAT
jgi:hypothetical protein